MVFDVGKAGELDISGRIKELRPVELLRDVAQIKEGMICIDLGCGTGTFSLPMAALAGSSGKVYAVDRSAVMLGHLSHRNPPANIINVQNDVAATGLDNKIADFCLMAFILHEVKEPDLIIREASRLLKPGGKALILEWREDKDSPGPPRQKRIGRERVKNLLLVNNFSNRSSIDWSDSYYVTTANKKP